MTIVESMMLAVCFGAVMGTFIVTVQTAPKKTC